MRKVISAMSETLSAMRRRLRLQSPHELRAGQPVQRKTQSNSPVLLLLNDCRDQINYGAEALVEGLLHIIAAAIPIIRYASFHRIGSSSRVFPVRFIEADRSLCQAKRRYGLKWLTSSNA